MKIKLSCTIWISFYLLSITKIKCQVLDLNMMTNSFDDQYIGCSEILEKDIMPDILKKEKSNEQFLAAWDTAADEWSDIKEDINLPDDFSDEYGIAIIVYTMEEPVQIYRQFNGNLSIAGKSRDFYMKNFHFKALHFYLTRALQKLAPECKEFYRTYRGTSLLYNEVSQVLRFGHFASSSSNKTIAEGFGTHTVFEILTCLGVYIEEFSFYEEQEMLIPVTELFENVGKEGNTYFLNSTGEKREDPICTSAFIKKASDSGNILFPSFFSFSFWTYIIYLLFLKLYI
ncbi:ecto-ADP-ribosyltransferase 3-like isoform X2 [Bombina bombina]|uniref:ecto-ADP-ribosyltransferase 3-like isoform X2 n=1 Tax=Bombina bombina TaxID=8345 RepID=UPI00235AE85F|nr:ecto-ADP-ribosyltransferase 3-like isoform X2 [Bombina bombina]